jgi:hypothetical protein
MMLSATGSPFASGGRVEPPLPSKVASNGATAVFTLQRHKSGDVHRVQVSGWSRWRTRCSPGVHFARGGFEKAVRASARR